MITRLIIFAFYGAGIRSEKVYGRHLKERKPVDFLGKKKIFFIVSIILCLAGPVMMGVNHARGIGAMNYSLDFVGGTSTNVTFDKEYTLEEIDSQMIPSLEEITGDKNIQVQTVKESNQVNSKFRDEKRCCYSCDHCYNLYAALHLVPFQRYSFRNKCCYCTDA